MRSRASTAARGYGAAHQALRRALAAVVRSGNARCSRCGLVIDPAALWDLDHSDDRSRYLGPAHRRCNRATASRRARRVSVAL